MSDSIKYIKEINTDKVFVALRDDGIGYLYFKDNTELNIELQLELLNMYNSPAFSTTATSVLGALARGVRVAIVAFHFEF